MFGCHCQIDNLKFSFKFKIVFRKLSTKSSSANKSQIQSHKIRTYNNVHQNSSSIISLHSSMLAASNF